ncbi:hypothetical protein [uncultured Pseudophaeobacter sp.]|jgi:hypothetical protein|uniref:hypothetical protein n=1 Tax=uncultured Pseudophaeobacter sp. TaxID=1759421 RepID=UPI0025D23C94|nr:hypothetical protein [uncultured Pseudophaeobacter sp.]
MRKVLSILALLVVSACSGTLPASYTPQTFVSLPGTRAAVGDFNYLPSDEGKVQSNQIQNTAIGNVLIGEDVAVYVRRATALELQKGGTRVDANNGKVISGQVNKILADDLGYSVRWSYSVTYTVSNRSSGAQVFQKTYEAKPRKTGKFSQPADFVAVFNAMITDGIEQFMSEVKRTRVLR